MFDNSFKAQWRKNRETRRGESHEAFKKNTQGYASMLKDRWPNFETEMMASVYSLMYLSEIASDDLHISEKDLIDSAGLDSAAARLADYLRQDSMALKSIWHDIDFPVKDLEEPFRTIIATFNDNVDFVDIARTFLESKDRHGL